MAVQSYTVGSGGQYATLALWYTARRLAVVAGDTEEAVLLDGVHDFTGSFNSWNVVHFDVVIRAQNSHGGDWNSGATLQFAGRSDWSGFSNQSVSIKFKDLVITYTTSNSDLYWNHVSEGSGGNYSNLFELNKCLISDTLSSPSYLFIIGVALYSTDTGQSISSGGTLTTLGNSTINVLSCVFSTTTASNIFIQEGVMGGKPSAHKFNVKGSSIRLSGSTHFYTTRSNIAGTLDAVVEDTLYDAGVWRLISSTGNLTNYTANVTDYITSETTSGAQMSYWANGTTHGTNTNVTNSALFNYDGTVNSGEVTYNGLTTSRILDSYGSAAAAYSVRKLRAGYGGACIRIVEDSGNTETDIGFDSNGLLNIADIASFCGTANGYIVKWYDQSGNSRDLQKATGSGGGSQPQIYDGSSVNLAGNKPALYFDGGSRLWTTTSMTLSSPLTILFAKRITGTASTYGTPLWGSLSWLSLVSDRTGSGGSYGINTALATGTPPANGVYTMLYGSDSATRSKGAEVASTTGNTTYNVTSFVLGGRYNSSEGNWNGDVHELIIWDSDLYTNNAADIEENTDNYFEINVKPDFTIVNNASNLAVGYSTNASNTVDVTGYVKAKESDAGAYQVSIVNTFTSKKIGTLAGADYASLALWYAGRRTAVQNGCTEEIVLQDGDHDFGGSFSQFNEVNFNIVIRAENSHNGDWYSGATLLIESTDSNWTFDDQTITFKIEDVVLQVTGSRRCNFVHLGIDGNSGNYSHQIDIERCLMSHYRATTQLFISLAARFYDGSPGNVTQLGTSKVTFNNCVMEGRPSELSYSYMLIDSPSGVTNRFAHMDRQFIGCTFIRILYNNNCYTVVDNKLDLIVKGCLYNNGNVRFNSAPHHPYTSNVTDYITSESSSGASFSNWANGTTHGTNTNVTTDAVFNDDGTVTAGQVSFKVNDNPHTFVLDTYPGAAAAYSVRKLRSGYNSHCMRIRRDSDDSERNISFVNNKLDTATIASHCGSANGYVVTWYDQSGNNRNATQSTPADQPQIYNGTEVLTENNQPALFFAADWLRATFTLSNLATQFVVAKPQNTTGAARYLTDGVTSFDYNAFGTLGLTSWRLINTGGSITTTYTNNTQSLFSYVSNASSSQSRLNSIATGAGTLGTNAMGGITIGKPGGNNADAATYGFPGYIQEIIHYEADNSSNFKDIEIDINKYYRIYNSSYKLVSDTDNLAIHYATNTDLGTRDVGSSPRVQEASYRDVGSFQSDFSTTLNSFTIGSGGQYATLQLWFIARRSLLSLNNSTEQAVLLDGDHDSPGVQTSWNDVNFNLEIKGQNSHKGDWEASTARIVSTTQPNFTFNSSKVKVTFKDLVYLNNYAGVNSFNYSGTYQSGGSVFDHELVFDRVLYAATSKSVNNQSIYLQHSNYDVDASGNVIRRADSKFSILNSVIYFANGDQRSIQFDSTNNIRNIVFNAIGSTFINGYATRRLTSDTTESYTFSGCLFYTANLNRRYDPNIGFANYIDYITNSSFNISGSAATATNVTTSATFNFDNISRNGEVCFKGYGTAAPLLDTYSGAAAAYSLRKLRTAYTGSCIRIREDGTNSETDIGFDSYGNLNINAIAAHCGSNNGFVVTWYDQSGNSRDATAAADTNEPKIYDGTTGVHTTNGKPTLQFDGTSDSLDLPDAVLPSAVNSCSAFTVQSNTNGISLTLGTESTNGRWYQTYVTGGTEYFGYATAATATNLGSASSKQKLITAIAGSTQGDAQCFVDGTSAGSRTLSTNSPGSGTGHISRDAVLFTGTIQEVIVYHSDQSANRSGIESNIDTYFGITKLPNLALVSNANNLPVHYALNTDMGDRDVARSTRVQDSSYRDAGAYQSDFTNTVNSFTVGNGGQYATLSLWYTARQNQNILNNALEEAVFLDGTHDWGGNQANWNVVNFSIRYKSQNHHQGDWNTSRARLVSANSSTIILGKQNFKLEMEDLVFIANRQTSSETGALNITNTNTKVNAAYSPELTFKNCLVGWDSDSPYYSHYCRYVNNYDTDITGAISEIGTSTINVINCLVEAKHSTTTNQPNQAFRFDLPDAVSAIKFNATGSTFINTWVRTRYGTDATADSVIKGCIIDLSRSPNYGFAPTVSTANTTYNYVDTLTNSNSFPGTATVTNSTAGLTFNFDDVARAGEVTFKGYPATSLLLDTYTGAAAAYSVRKLSTTYAGACMRIREDGSNTQTDIGFDANGDLDTAAIAAHCGSNNGYVVTWYDQSGNGQDVTQATAANQPQIYNGTAVLTDNGKPCVEFDTNGALVTSNSAFSGTSQSMFIVCNSDVNHTTDVIVGLGPNSGYKTRRLSASHQLEVVNNNKNWSGVTGSQQLLSLIPDGGATTISDYDLYRDGSLLTPTTTFVTQNLQSCAGGVIYVGGVSPVNTSYAFDGKLQEVVMYNSDQSSNRTGVENNISSYFKLGTEIINRSVFTLDYTPTSSLDNLAVQYTLTAGTELDVRDVAYRSRPGLADIGALQSLSTNTVTNIIGTSAGANYATLPLWYTAVKDTILNGITEEVTLQSEVHELGGTFNAWKEVGFNLLIKGSESHGGNPDAGARLVLNSNSNWNGFSNQDVHIEFRDTVIEYLSDACIFNQVWPTAGASAQYSNSLKFNRCYLTNRGLFSHSNSFIVWRTRQYDTDLNGNVTALGTSTIEVIHSVVEAARFSSLLRGDGLNVGHPTHNVCNLTNSTFIGSNISMFAYRYNQSPDTQLTVNVKGCILDNSSTRLISSRQNGTYSSTVIDYITSETTDSSIFYYWAGGSYGSVTNATLSQSFYYDNTVHSGETSFVGYRTLTTKLLDEYTGATAAYSVRKLRTAYTGPCMRVREDSGNTETDIGFDSNGDLDTAAIASHCGSANGYVVTWYDQSGNSQNATQSVAADQPQIYNGTAVIQSNGLPAIQFDGSTDGLEFSLGNAPTTVALTIETSDTLFIPVGYQPSPQNYLLIGQQSAGNPGWSTWRSASGNFVYVNSTTALNETTQTRGDVYNAIGTGNQTLVFLEADAGPTGVCRLGEWEQNGNHDYNGKMSEVVLWQTDHSSSRSGIESNINTYFSIYGSRGNGSDYTPLGAADNLPVKYVQNYTPTSRVDLASIVMAGAGYSDAGALQSQAGTTSKIIGPSAADYATLALWYAARYNQVLNGGTEEAILQDGTHDWGGNFNNYIPVNFNIVIKGQNSHNGNWSDGATLNVNSNMLFEFSDQSVNVKFEDVVIERTQSYGLNFNHIGTAGSSGIYNNKLEFNRCLITTESVPAYFVVRKTRLYDGTVTGTRDHTSYTALGTSAFEIINSVFEGSQWSIVYCDSSSITDRLANRTILVRACTVKDATVQWRNTLGPTNAITVEGTLVDNANMTNPRFCHNPIGIASTVTDYITHEGPFGGEFRGWNNPSVYSNHSNTNVTLSKTFYYDNATRLNEVTFVGPATGPKRNFRLKDSSSNLPVSYAVNATMPILDVSSTARDEFPDAGAFERQLVIIEHITNSAWSVPVTFEPGDQFIIELTGPNAALNARCRLNIKLTNT